MGNKNTEKDCIDKALKYSKTQHGKSKSIINMLKGIDVQRQEDERPDFLKRAKDIDGKEILIGIEHFQVDGVSIKKKNGKYAGTEQKRLKDTKEIFNKYKKQMINNDFISDDVFRSATEEINNVVKTAVEYYSNATYKDFVNAFEQKLTAHAKNIPAYYQNVEQYKRNNEKAKMMFLIDVFGNFSGLFFNSNKKVKQVNVDETPLFSEIVNILDNVIGNKIDYIVICLGNGTETKIIGIEAKNILQELNKQKIKIYDYLCYDRVYPLMTNAKCLCKIVKQTKDEITTNLECTSQQLDTKTLLLLSYHYFYFCYQSRKHKKNFITNSSIQLLLDVLSKYLCTWKLYCNGNIKLYFPIFNINDIDILNQEISDFEKQWSINDD